MLYSGIKIYTLIYLVHNPFAPVMIQQTVTSNEIIFIPSSTASCGNSCKCFAGGKSYLNLRMFKKL